MILVVVHQVESLIEIENLVISLEPQDKFFISNASIL